MGVLFEMTHVVNEIMEAIAVGMFLLVVSYSVAKYSLQTLREDGLGQGLYLSIIYILQFFLVVLIFLILPYLLEKYLAVAELSRWIRWGEILLAGFIYFRLRKHAEIRGVSSFIGHYLLLFFAWLIDRWVGIIFIALPLLFAYYNTMWRVSHEIMPITNPEDKKEKRARFWVFLSYAWGIQQPLWKASSTTAGEVEKRIEGKPCFIKFDSMIWTYPHQVIGITEGPKFSVGGPGLTFIGKGKNPFDIVDLRENTKKSTIKAISKEGISFDAEVIVTFRVDNEAWTKEQHQQLRRENTLLRDGKELDKNLNGAFPYSQARVKSVLSYRSQKNTIDGEQTERWDNHVLSMAEEAAREVLAERSIKELWRAREDENSSAAEEIVSEMKGLIKDPLRIHGIKLINTKVTKFSFKNGDVDEKEEEGKIAEQQIMAWSTEWERRRTMSLANGRAESERFQQEARAYAHSILLTAIAEGLQQARAIHPNLPRYIIALRYIGALEEMIEQQPEAGKGEKQIARANINSIKEQLLSKSQGE